MNNMDIKRLDRSNPDFYTQLDSLLAREQVSDSEVEQTVRDIISAIRSRGDEALLELTRRFDRVQADSVEELEIINSSVP